MIARLGKGSNKFIDKALFYWQKCGMWLSARPAQIMGTLVACIIVIALIAITADSRNDIRAIQDALCNSPGEVYSSVREHRCQELLSKLLENPTQEQKERLREIVRGTP